MAFSVSEEVFDKCPNLIVGICVVHGVNNSGSHPEIVELLRNAENQVCSSLDLETFKDDPRIASLQEVHRAFGNNPNKFPPSHQALIKRVLKGGELPSISPLVDLYNVISLKHVLPAGGEDIDVCDGDIRLTAAKGDEEFIELGSTENDPPKEGEFIYRDDVGVICRKLDWREADHTKLTENTKNAVLVIEALPPIDKAKADEVLSELKELVLRFCSGEVRVEILDGERSSCEV